MSRCPLLAMPGARSRTSGHRTECSLLSALSLFFTASGGRGDTLGQFTSGASTGPLSRSCIRTNGHGRRGRKPCVWHRPPVSVTKSYVDGTQECLCAFFFFFWLFEVHTRGIWEFPRVGSESNLQLPAYAATTATQDRSHVCDLHHSSRPRQILNPQSEARDRTLVLMDTNRVCNC